MNSEQPQRILSIVWDLVEVFFYFQSDIKIATRKGEISIKIYDFRSIIILGN